MTWIKPSFTWMTYRCGWATKPGQERVLAIDLLREGFEWALSHSAASNFDPLTHSSREEWQALLRASPVRIQWDPERTVTLEALPWRTIQVGLRGDAVDSYVDQWIVAIEDVTSLVKQVESLVLQRDFDQAKALLPVERPYPLTKEIADRIGCAVSGEGDGPIG